MKYLCWCTCGKRGSLSGVGGRKRVLESGKLDGCGTELWVVGRSGG